MELKKIAVIHTDFPEKFGIPRQSNLADTRGRIVLEEEYRREEAVRGLEDYSYLWLIWEFSEGKREEWSPTVRPPRLGGNCRMGVFATRSPFRPNPLGLSSVKLDRIEVTEKEGPVLYVTGADLLDGTPIYDIKPYLPYVDLPGKCRTMLFPCVMKMECWMESEKKIERCFFRFLNRIRGHLIRMIRSGSMEWLTRG